MAPANLLFTTQEMMVASAETADPDEAVLANAYWVDVDVALSGIVHRRLRSPFNLVRHQPLSIVEDCVLEGVGAVGVAPNETNRGDKNLFAVRISRKAEDPDGEPTFAHHADCQVIWDKRGDHSWQSNIYLSEFMLRHIVEFFVTKRIDSVRLSIHLSVWENASGGAVEASRWRGIHPGFVSDRHTRCRLLSIYTSKGKIYPD